MKHKILVVPELTRPADVRPLVHRLAFYFAPVESASIVLVGGDDVRLALEGVLADPAPPPGYGPVTADRVRAMGERFSVVPTGEDREALVDGADVVIVADTSAKRAWEPGLARRTRNLTVVEADVHRTRQEGGQLAEIAHRMYPRRHEDVQRSKERLATLIEDLGGASSAYLVATGPSARRALDIDLSDGVRIVCNTVVLDDELMRHVRPQIVTFADPIFHFGPSAYACRFRAALAAAARAHEFAVVVPSRYERLLAGLVPDLEPRLIGIAHGSSDMPANLNLSIVPVVKPRPNILTMLMLPLAATLTDDIGLIGFDGREPGETYFWKHGQSVQLHDELEGIRQVHPAFFDLSYDDYYTEHVQAVEAYACSAEVLGKRVRSLTPSHMPPLRRRAATDELLPPRPDMPLVDGKDLVVSVEPDWISDFGHYRRLNTVLHSLATSHGKQFVSLTSRGLCPDADWQRPTFTHPTSRPNAAPLYSETFRTELTGALDELTRWAGRVTVVFYTADLWHLPALLSAARHAKGDVRVAVNLMRAHTELVTASADPSRGVTWAGTLLREAADLASSLGVTLTVDSEELGDDVEALTGARLQVWPMTVLQQIPETRENGSGGERPVRVYSPVRPFVGRGYVEFAALALAVSKSPDSADFSLVARYETPPDGPATGVERGLADLESAGATVVRGELDDEQYLAELLRADIVVIPYRLADFRTRTSAVFLDAVLAGRPVVVTAGTWMAGVVERYGVGETFADQDVADLERAVRLVADNIEERKKQVRDVRKDIAAEFAPQRLWDFLEALPGDKRSYDAARDDQAQRFHGQTRAALSLSLEQQRALSAARGAQIMRTYYEAREREKRLLRIDKLGRTVRRRTKRLGDAKNRLQKLSSKRRRHKRKRRKRSADLTAAVRGRADARLPAEGAAADRRSWRSPATGGRGRHPRR